MRVRCGEGEVRRRDGRGGCQVRVKRTAPLLLSSASGLLLLAAVATARLCPSMDIRNSVSQFSLLQDCHRIQGFLQVVVIEYATEADYRNLSFPNLTEVTSFVIFYRVQGLTSIGKLFPNLSLIGGDFLSLDYALIISQMGDLKEIDLPKLRVIKRGSVAIVNNPKLCFVETVNWDLIASSGDNWISRTKNNALCPTCNCPPENRCWSRSHCQVLEWGTNCHPECLGGCSGPSASECHACRHYTHGTQCVPHCPQHTYDFEKRRCVSASECGRMGQTLLRPGRNETSEAWFIWERRCVNSCPRGLERDPLSGCKTCPGKCELVCPGMRVESLASAQLLRDCTIINGSLEVQINSGNQSYIHKELEENLGDIEEVTGYLKISRSFPLTNLNFLRNLRVIHGSQVEISPMNYSLIILDNQNLHLLWDWENRPAKRNFTILNGRIFFHFNPNLCLKHIYELAKISGQQNITNLEVAAESNGNNFACHSIDIRVNVVSRTSTDITLLISWPPLKNIKYSVMQRMYMVYHIKAPFRNLTADYKTRECDDHSWTVNDATQSKETFYYKITNLEPNTQYALFVKTYTVESIGGQSPIQYFKTLPSQPTWPNDLRGVSTNSSSITLFWTPPDKANGVLNEYRITGFMREEEYSMLKDMDFCAKSSREMFQRKIEETTTVLPEFKTKVTEEEDCCRRDQTMKKIFVESDAAVLCQNIDPREPKLPSIFLSSLKAKNLIQTCEKYMYNLIESSVLEHPSVISKRAVEDNFNFSKNIDLYREDIFQFPFSQTVGGDVLNWTFTELEPYSLYTFQVEACREVERESENQAEGRRCSLPSLVTLRTQLRQDADTIPWLHAEVNNRSVVLKWQAPITPNYKIMAYDVEYRRIDIPNVMPMTDCINAKDFLKKGSFVLNGLAVGKYSFRVRAISLAQVGPHTDPVTASVTEFPPRSIVILILLVCVFGFCILACALSFAYYKKKMMLSERVLLAEVNPEYLGVPTEVDEEWELPRERIQIIKELKRGNFGVVCEGLLLPEEKRVAVKKLVDTAGDRDRVEFLNEASVMKQFTSAHHVVQLIGIVSRDFPRLVVMEMMELGDLKSYLRECRNYNPPSPNQMLLMAAQIADGMAFLEGAKFVHRDLAARNCMVRSDLVVKIGDFGMTRDVYETDYYRKGDKGLLPIRWMAPESLNDGVFTNKSDSWSYGIVLWEMATLASQPYVGMSNEQVLAYVVSGNKLELPLVYPKPFKALMLWCWKWKPKFRPCFLQILDDLIQHTTKAFREVSYYDSPEGRIARELLAAQPSSSSLEPNYVNVNRTES